MSRPALIDEDGEIRDLTLEDIKLFRPIAAIDPGMPDAAKRTERRGGRPKVETPKVHTGFRLAADIVKGIKATGKGYNARVERVLRDALAAGKLDGPGDRFDRAAHLEPRR